MPADPRVLRFSRDAGAIAEAVVLLRRRPVAAAPAGTVGLGVRRCARRHLVHVDSLVAVPAHPFSGLTFHLPRARTASGDCLSGAYGEFAVPMPARRLLARCTSWRPLRLCVDLCVHRRRRVSQVEALEFTDGRKRPSGSRSTRSQRDAPASCSTACAKVTGTETSLSKIDIRGLSCIEPPVAGYGVSQCSVRLHRPSRWTEGGRRRPVLP